MCGCLYLRVFVYVYVCLWTRQSICMYSSTSLRTLWDDVASLGPGYGYFSNATKTWLVTEEGLVERARELFANQDVNARTYERTYNYTHIFTFIPTDVRTQKRTQI